MRSWDVLRVEEEEDDEAESASGEGVLVAWPSSSMVWPQVSRASRIRRIDRATLNKITIFQDARSDSSDAGEWSS